MALRVNRIRETGKAGLPAADWVSCIRVVEFNEIYVERREISRCIDVLRAARVPGVPRVLKKNRKEKKDSALKCIILFQISQPS